MAGFGGSVKLTGESDYRKAIQSITQDLSKMSKELQDQTKDFAQTDKGLEATTKDEKALNDQLKAQETSLAKAKSALAQYTVQVQAQQTRHSELTKEYKNAVKELDKIGKESGETSEEYKKQLEVVSSLEQEMAKSTEEMNESKSAMSKLKSEINTSEKVIRNTKQEIESLGSKTEESGKKALISKEQFEKLKDVAKGLGIGIAGAVTAIGASAVGAGKALWDMANDVSAVGDNIDKESQKLGISAENYQALSYAMERSGSSIEDIGKGMVNINKNLADVENGVKGAGKSFDELGVSLKNADGSMKSSEQVLFDSIDALADMENETQRNALAQQIFGKSYQELAPMLNSGSDDLHELMQEAKDYGMVMSDEAVSASAQFQDSLTKMQGTLNGVKNNMIGEFLPGLTTLTNGFSALVNGEEYASDMIKGGVESIISSISEMIPQVTELIGTLSSAVLESAPEIIKALADGIMEAIPLLLPVVTDVISSLTDMMVDMLPQIIDAGIQIILALANGIIASLPKIIASVPKIIVAIVSTIVKYLPQIIQTGVQLLQTLINGLMQNLGTLKSKVGEIGNAIIAKLKEFPSKVMSVGKDIVRGIWDGISNHLSWIKDKIKGWVGNVTSFLKKLFGIASPSKLYRDVIGKNLALGIGEGFSQEMKNVSAEMADSIPTSFDVGATVTGSSAQIMQETSFDTMVEAFKEALYSVKIELDDEVAGNFVDRTVTRLIYT